MSVRNCKSGLNYRSSNYGGMHVCSNVFRRPSSCIFDGNIMKYGKQKPLIKCYTEI